MPLQLDDLAALDAPVADAGGLPMLLPLGLIDEDLSQPRSEFDPLTLQELANTIAERGVRQPISVRPNAKMPGRWMLNFGARRLRASKLAGKTEIPAFVDKTADSYDQVIENEQREGLKPLELALFVQRRISAGDSQAEIARRMGKSRAYVTHATALIDAPDWLMAAYREGRCRGLSDLYELRKLHGAHPQRVEAWTSDREAITRDRVRALGAELNQAGDASRAAVSHTVATADAGSPGASAGEGSSHVASPARNLATHLPALRAKLDGVVVSVLVDRVPDLPGQIFVCWPGITRTEAVDASRLMLIGFATV